MEQFFTDFTDKIEKRYKKIEDILTNNFKFNEFLRDRQDFTENLTKLQDVIEKSFSKIEMVDEQLNSFKVVMDGKFKDMENPLHEQFEA